MYYENQHQFNMRNMNRSFIILLTFSFLLSCSRFVEETRQVNEENVFQFAEMPFQRFESKDNLREVVSHGTSVKTKGMESEIIASLFVPIKCVDVQKDPVLLYECLRRGVMDTNNDLSLYELLGYDELIPNENFASLLNARGEICVGDIMYKISPRGTYYFPVSVRDSFERKYAEYEQQDGEEIAKDTYLIDTEVYRFDTFKDDSDIVSFSLFQNGGNYDNSSVTKSDPSFPYFNWSSYPTYTGSVNTYFNNQLVTYSLPNNRRVRTKIYHHDYVVYDERGATLKCQKSGLGWSAVTSNALMLTWKNIILKTSYGTGEIPPPSNIIPTYVTETVTYMDHSETLMTIRGYVIPDTQLNSVVTGGASTLRSIILNATGFDINNCRLVILQGHDYIQVFYAGSWHVSGENVKEVKMALAEQWMGATAQPLGGQFWYQALDDNNNLGALRVGTAF